MYLLALPFPAINPVMIELGPIEIRWYSLAYILGLFLAIFYSKRLLVNSRLWLKPQVLTTQMLDDLLLWVAFGIIIGGRLGYVLFYDPVFYFQNPMQIPVLWSGGMSFHGGFLGAVSGIVLFARRKSLSILVLLDLAGASAAFGLFFGRLANFINGELFGRITDVPWAFVFPAGGPLPRHPSQLYEAGLEGIGLFIVARIATHQSGVLKYPGAMAGIFAIWYGASRIVVEFFRMPDQQIGYLLGPITMGMVLSLPMVIAGGVLLVSSMRQPET
ncbi:MAG: prolipoprotein diacylglyceryl transferase [Cohaesibacteraceae bacterium]|nr:prolipoprotein diacylglyceryl transferase [Cohaesibacteraceae bacterium]MBL4875312.1 prolipoprotein diacylglyceryl transferase [Cohaesibacteraceae bacterium]MBL4877139.1 prolipoprotein diacylglyceryl transferase [Cohaesibacteraceae bacterium]